MEKSNVEKLKEIIGETGRWHATLGPDGAKMSEEEIAGMILASIQDVMDGKAEIIAETVIK